MGRIREKWVVLGLVAGAIAGFPLPAEAQVCRAGSPVAPSVETREFRSDRFGVAFQIPANYRAMLRSDGDVTFHDPATFEFIQCLTRTGRYGAIALHTTLEVSPAPEGIQDLVLLVRRKRPWVDFYRPEFVPIDLAGKATLRYRYTSEIYRTDILNYSFRSADGQTLVTLTGPASDPVLTQAIATLTFTDTVTNPVTRPAPEPMN